jgi:hypothetical protein
MFIAFGGPQSLRASSLATLIITGVKEENTEPDDPSSDDTTSLNNLLVFLWAVKQGFSSPVLLSDPPDTDNCDSFFRDRGSSLPSQKRVRKQEPRQSG